MNQTAALRQPKGAPTLPPLTPENDEVRRQARELDALFKAIARKVLVDDDPALELPLRQLRVCAALFEGARTMKELSLELGVSQSAVTQLADRLEAAGMVRRGEVGDDRRVRNLELTDRARKLMVRREQRRIQRVMQLLERVTAAQREAVLESLGYLKDASVAGELKESVTSRTSRRAKSTNS